MFQEYNCLLTNTRKKQIIFKSQTNQNVLRLKLQMKAALCRELNKNFVQLLLKLYNTSTALERVIINTCCWFYIMESKHDYQLTWFQESSSQFWILEYCWFTFWLKTLRNSLWGNLSRAFVKLKANYEPKIVRSDKLQITYVIHVTEVLSAIYK
jgi:hypothetical protein